MTFNEYIQIIRDMWLATGPWGPLLATIFFASFVVAQVTRDN